MRVTPAEMEAIRQAAREIFGESARVWVFGSRLRDDLKGGDLDLFVEVDASQASIANEQRLRDAVGVAVDDLRMDITLHERGRPLPAIGRIALRDGVSL